MANVLMSQSLFAEPLWVIALILALLVWTVAWKGFAMWHAAREGDKWWFVAFLLINTIAVLELIYLYIVLRRRKKSAIQSADKQEEE